MTHRATILTRIYTDEGIVGEAFVGDEDHINDQIERVIRDEITPKLIGEDAFAVERCWELARPATWNILRDRRIGLVACAAVDSAIWDAVGKAVEQPLWRLWGGYRNKIQVIWTGGYYNTDVPIAKEMEAARTAQIAGMKFKVGGRSPEIDALRFIEARQAAGNDFVLIADANQGYTPDQAVRFARLVEDYDLFYFEEPCQWQNDRRAMRDVRYRSGARVCAGQSEMSAGGCRDLMVESAIDFCNFDGSWSGGPTEWRRVAAMALSFDVKMCHHEEAHIGGHLLAAIPHGTFADTMHEDRDPIWSGLISNRPETKDGYITLPSRPGLGWELDEDFIAKYRISYDT
jgi:L-alanine-DL-glutamate epimerase-like enolase superfamily enzyme